MKILTTPRMERCIGCHCCSLACSRLGHRQLSSDAAGIPIRSTNTALWERQEEDMDINCGVIVDGKSSIQEVGQRFFDLIVKTASGQPSKSEIFGYGDDEFAPWVLGPTM